MSAEVAGKKRGREGGRMPRSLLVGIIGVRVDRAWAKKSHVPAVRKLTGRELAATATTGPAKADVSARAFDATAYGDGADLSLKVA
jgi:hypothetical protein